LTVRLVPRCLEKREPASSLSVLHDARSVNIRTCNQPPSFDELLAPYVPLLIAEVVILVVVGLVAWVTP